MTSNESAEPTFFDVVRIGDSDDARKLGMNGAEGVVLGISEDEVTGEKWFGVAVGDRPSAMFPSSDLTPTGRSVPRESIYSGDSVRVSQDGRILGYTSARRRRRLDRAAVTADAPPTELAQRLTAIAVAAAQYVGVNSYEDLLIDLLELLRSGQVDRSDAVREFEHLATEWPPGAVEVLEFTMHELRWPEVRGALEDHEMHGADFRTRNLATRALQAFEDHWPGGEIYRTYRHGTQ